MNTTKQLLINENKFIPIGYVKAVVTTSKAAVTDSPTFLAVTCVSLPVLELESEKQSKGTQLLKTLHTG